MTPYEIKFKEFIAMCLDAKSRGVEGVAIPDPQTLGDDYEEILESLSRLADQGLALVIVARRKRHLHG